MAYQLLEQHFYNFSDDRFYPSNSALVAKVVIQGIDCDIRLAKQRLIFMGAGRYPVSYTLNGDLLVSKFINGSLYAVENNELGTALIKLDFNPTDSSLCYATREMRKCSRELPLYSCYNPVEESYMIFEIKYQQLKVLGVIPTPDGPNDLRYFSEGDLEIWSVNGTEIKYRFNFIFEDTMPILTVPTALSVSGAASTSSTTAVVNREADVSEEAVEGS